MKRRFSARLGATRKKNNHPAALGAKVRLRELVLDQVGADRSHVFDAFGGDGELHRRVWRRAAGYVAVDMKWYRDERLAYVADNRRVMRAVDLRAFTIFDFDAYGSPWEQVLILCARRKVAAGEKIGIVLTEGTSLKLRFSGAPRALEKLARVKAMPGIVSQSEMIIDRAIARTAELLRCRIVKRWQAKGKTGAAMRYFGLVLEGL